VRICVPDETVRLGASTANGRWLLSQRDVVAVRRGCFYGVAIVTTLQPVKHMAGLGLVLGLFSALLGPARTRSRMFDRLQRRNNSHGLVFKPHYMQCGLLLQTPHVAWSVCVIVLQCRAGESGQIRHDPMNHMLYGAWRRISRLLEIRRIDLYSGRDVACCYHYCSNSLVFRMSSKHSNAF